MLVKCFLQIKGVGKTILLQSDIKKDYTKSISQQKRCILSQNFLLCPLFLTYQTWPLVFNFPTLNLVLSLELFHPLL